MTRKELEDAANEARRRAFELDKRVGMYRKADLVRDPSTVLTINNTTVAWSGAGGITDVELVKAVRAFIADKIEIMDPK